MTAEEVKDKLRGRHPAINQGIVGEWTTLEEWMQIDLLAVSAWRSNGVPYRRVGYEVKVSRSDYRREILNPGKRRFASEFCHEFYFAVPADLLRPEEISYTPPPEFDDWASFEREDCRYSIGGADDPGWRVAEGELGRCHRGKRQRIVGVEGEEEFRYLRQRTEEEPCEGCQGRGFEQLSLVEREAPTLWIPADVGLVEITGRGCRVTKRAPVNKEAKISTGHDALFAAIARYVSVRPDPRHAALR